ncbi:MAG: S41 family peptidase [Candidatus Harrisonbacteria bacterium CG10_big_fil_rev_8_21_14_0_10_49_15]|uniref:S41 family peptidase n=1 Tax=Candidatus Harrisonbacteria bacterium CG10_big_fil_rev_8_21_14_0_10_49_15 TaxID=1974587 RepID=A0A2H0UK63_9BACT|nr:MAG: S41 family peptidase [Candidatus Harrisonbacteria bacterium CG10_big_fil_rev_8_21_14_0_10_49_15]
MFHFESPRQKRVTITVVFILTAVLLGGGFLLGQYQATGAQALYPPYGADVLEPAVELDAEFSLFWEAWQQLRSRHVKAPDFTDQDFVYGGVEGLAGTFNDPYTTFFPPTEAEQFNENVKGNFGGIGAEIGIRNDILTVIAPLEDSPAQAEGLKAGDAILRIDGQPTEGMTITEAVGHIRGEVGTVVVLTLMRDSWLAPQEISVTRGRISIPTLKTELHENGKIIQIRLFAFNENATKEFYKAVSSALSSGVEGVVLDLRNNPGGFLEVAVDLAGWFLERGDVVVSERFRGGDEQEFLARGNAALLDVPVVVLINQGSASASEILAGALRDQRQIPLVGEISFGKGTVQELVPLSDGSSLKVTIAEWVLPGGQVLSSGLEPDHLVSFTDEDLEAERDVQLEKALEVLRTSMSN